MRRVYLLAFFFLVVFATATNKSHGQERSMVPGLRAGEKQINTANLEMDPPAFQSRRPLDGAALSRDAAELARLSSIVPGQIEQLKAGKFHKDLAEELKRIEKLAKHLRTEVAP